MQAGQEFVVERHPHPFVGEPEVLREELQCLHFVVKFDLLDGETWRLHPSICALTSELFYEGRLESRPDLNQQALVGSSPFVGAGLWFVPVEHEGNQNSSLEEMGRVAELHATLLAGDLSWTTRLGIQAHLTERDILIVAP